ncbi:hypothetical protein FJY63_03640 [Candidatus Sumerlaeota bacterium]|nr:hypothetical protein [Candidatus Sumerlaeota bacterium]
MEQTYEQVLAMVQEKIKEKNEVIREQQLQIQELQQRIVELEGLLAAQRAQPSTPAELLKKISEIVEVD